ncbi:MAG: tripartite tricarboxylate transporter TctB family protein [Thermodesulfobacteriota bacterium]
MRKEDIGIGIGLIFLSLWLYWYVGRYSSIEVYYYGPDFFPRILSIIMVILGISLILNAWVGNVLKKIDRIDTKGFVRMLISIGICIGYLFLMKILGFTLATFIFLFILMTFLKQKGIIVRILSCLITSIAIWMIFRYFLIIPLSEGLFFKLM